MEHLIVGIIFCILLYGAMKFGKAVSQSIRESSNELDKKRPQ